MRNWLNSAESTQLLVHLKVVSFQLDCQVFSDKIATNISDVRQVILISGKRLHQLAGKADASASLVIQRKGWRVHGTTMSDATKSGGLVWRLVERGDDRVGGWGSDRL